MQKKLLLLICICIFFCEQSCKRCHPAEEDITQLFNKYENATGVTVQSLPPKLVSVIIRQNNSNPYLIDMFKRIKQIKFLHCSSSSDNTIKRKDEIRNEFEVFLERNGYQQLLDLNTESEIIHLSYLSKSKELNELISVYNNPRELIVLCLRGNFDPKYISVLKRKVKSEEIRSLQQKISELY